MCLTKSALRALAAVSIMTTTLLPSYAGPATGNSLTLWYQQPATNWTGSLPVGTGRQLRV